MSRVTFITPVAVHHLSTMHFAVSSVGMQLAAVEHLVIQDLLGRGPAWARNEGLAQVQTEFVVFLDADDTAAPNFAQATLEAWKPGHYVYTGFSNGRQIFDAPLCPWTGDAWHPITTLIPTDWARRVGGFDESLIFAEDRDFYLRLIANGCCPLRLPESLMTYRPGGVHSKRWFGHPRYTAVLRAIDKRYGIETAAWSPGSE